MKTWKISLIALAAALITASAAFAASETLAKDTLIVGTESTFPPMEFRSSTGDLVGYDIDIVEAIGEKLGKKVEWVDMSFDGLIPSLLMHKIDLIAAGMAATPERKKKIAFSDITNHSEAAFFVLKGNEKATAADFEGKTIAAQLGTIQDAYAKKMENVTVNNYQKTDDCLREVLYGRVDAALIDGPAGYEYLQAKDFAGKITLCAITDVASASSGSALGIAKDDEEFLTAVNTALAELKSEGTYQNIRDKWHLDDWKKLAENKEE